MKESTIESKTLNEMFLNFKNTPERDVYGNKIKINIFNVKEINDLTQNIKTTYERIND